MTARADGVRNAQPGMPGSRTSSIGLAERHIPTKDATARYARYLDFLIEQAEKAEGQDRADLMDRIERVLGLAPKTPVCR